MSAESDALKQRTFRFALDILDFVDTFPHKTSAFVVGKQLARSATGVAANYRASCVARSRAEFIAKLGVVHEEADESELWTGIAEAKQMGDGRTATRLHAEATELMKIFARSLRTARDNSNIRQINDQMTK